MASGYQARASVSLNSRCPDFGRRGAANPTVTGRFGNERQYPPHAERRTPVVPVSVVAVNTSPERPTHDSGCLDDKDGLQ
jgi:hypothetical protein